MKKAPCMECSEREVGCHGTCQKYAEYRNERINLTRARREHNAKFANKWAEKSYKVSKYSPLRNLRKGEKGYCKEV